MTIVERKKKHQKKIQKKKCKKSKIAPKNHSKNRIEKITNSHLKPAQYMYLHHSQPYPYWRDV
jgi:hypothetical protein